MKYQLKIISKNIEKTRKPLIVSDMTSRGPTRDERIKPDIMAIGNGIKSALSSDTGDKSCIVTYDTGTYDYMLRIVHI